MADTDVERSHRAELQRTRRLAKRTCGRLQVAICQAKLDGPKATTPWCAFNEVHPLELQPQVPTAGIMIEARLLPATEVHSAGHRTLPGRFLGALGHIFRPRSAGGTKTAITGK